MRTDRYYYLSALPALGGLGSAAPIGFAHLLEREAFLSGEITDVSPAVLTVQQSRNEAALPDDLAPRLEGDTELLEADRLWEGYFRHAAETGRALGSPLLVQWVGFEAALRNALAAARAKRLEIEGTGYLVATDLAESNEDFSAVLSEWAAAETPLAGLRVVIRARWEWLSLHDAWFSFSEDELVAYAIRLMLLEQWRRSTHEEELSAAETA